ncbi:MAG: ribosomal L7Ae/L30e/S12e/Gadd45 family protein [Nitrososphaeraceae archaeon]
MKNLEKIIKEAKSSNKYKEGIKEVKSNIKGSKLIIVSSSLNNADRQLLEKSSEDHKVPIYHYNDNSIKLGKLFNRPYRISAVALKAVSEDDINALLESK